MKNKDLNNEQKEQQEQNQEQKEKNDKELDIDTLKQELGKMNDQYLRLYADFDNYRKRVQKEIEDVKEATKRSLINEFLVILDNMEKALRISQDHKDSIIEGIELTMKSFKDILKKHGVEEINPDNEQFNPDLHDALMMKNSEDLPKNIVMQTLEKGYTYKDKLIRPAKVVVSAGISKKEENETAKKETQTNNSKED